MKANGYNESVYKFAIKYDRACRELKMGSDFATRYLNEGFSGGEKKRNEILQMKMIKPKFAILDEIDSGLDVDALRIVGENVSSMVNENFGCLLITHYQRLLDYIKPDYVHIMINGKIVKTGGKELIEKIDREGYDWVKRELGIEIETDEKKRIVLGTCGAKSIANE
jgi:Fe-S cluster assembly ATP-binding protein